MCEHNAQQAGSWEGRKLVGRPNAAREKAVFLRRCAHDRRNCRFAVPTLGLTCVLQFFQRQDTPGTDCPLRKMTLSLQGRLSPRMGMYVFGCGLIVLARLA